MKRKVINMLFFAISPFVAVAQNSVTKKSTPAKCPVQHAVLCPAKKNVCPMKELMPAEKISVNWGKKLIPITKEQAEVLVTKLVTAQMQNEIEAAKLDSAVLAIKVRVLKRKLLDQALRKVYMTEADQRMDRMERLLYFSLLKNGKISPQELQVLLGGGYGRGAAGNNIIVNTISPALQRQLSGPQTTAGVNEKKPVAKEQQEENLQLGDLQGQLSDQEGGIKETASSNVPQAPETFYVGTVNEPAKTDTVYVHQKRQAPFKLSVFFDFNSSQLSSDGVRKLTELAKYMKKELSLNVLLKGYASPEGNLQYNNALSGRRVRACADFLLRQGIGGQRITIQNAGINSVAQPPQDARRVDIQPNFWK